MKSSRLVPQLFVASLVMQASASLAHAGAKAPSHAVIPPFERFHAGGNDPLKGGQLLLGELNCISCHKPDAGQEAIILPRKAPILDGVGHRVKRGYLKKFLGDPQAVKPGTPMPHLLAGLPDQERADTVNALVHFLASIGTVAQEKPDKKGIVTGRDLYSKVGCVACHGTRDAAGNQAKLFATSVPLGDVKAKYSLTSLRLFLENPHATRPSARMPGLLNAKEAQEVANYLLQGVAGDNFPPNLNYTYFEGVWGKLPDFKSLKPIATGQASGFDLTLARRGGDFAMQFEGYLRVNQDGEFRFHLTSDDGSHLFIDDKLVVNHDSIHAPSTKSGAAKLKKGMHKFRTAVFNAGGGVELAVEFEGPGLGRQSIFPYLSLTEEGSAPKTAKTSDKTDEENFPLQPELVDRGRELFANLGCASCHQLQINKKALVSKLTAPGLAKSKPEGGCLEKTPKKGLPQYALSAAQQDALVVALKAPLLAKPQASELVARTLTTFNCYACHVRDKVGGVEEDLNALFTTTQPEMGDEGRIPPSLTGAGAKLTASYLKKVLDLGAHDRPYMQTRMPKFGDGNVGQLATLFAQLDSLEDVAAVKFAQPLAKVKAEGRHIVGAQLLGCIKCHTFNGNKAEGVQGIDMAIMTERVKREWFHQYLLNPNKFRPGTRMPTAWPDGKTLMPKILEGDAKKQIEAIWVYLADNKKAMLPVGVKKLFLPLIPGKDAIVYRNFLEGAGARAIGVGFPEKANLAFDANGLRLAMIWHGYFLDAARHWTDRGVGYEPPLGDNILHLPSGATFAVLAKAADAWPTKTAKELGFRFQGYRLTPDERPTFLYALGDTKIEDFPNTGVGKNSPTIVRMITLTGEQKNLYFRAAVATKIESLGDGWFNIDGAWKMHLDTPAQVRTGADGKMELLVSVRFKDGQAKIVQEYVW